MKMADRHKKSFLGESTGMIFESGSWTDSFFFLRFIKKKHDGSWERPTQGEGKAVKFSLDDMTYIIRLLHGVETFWATTHYFQDQQTEISFKWEKNEVLWIHVADYSKKLNNREIEVLKSLFEHVFQEKIGQFDGPNIMKEFKINPYLTLKLENDKICIYVNNKRFLQYKPQKMIPSVQEFSEHCSNLQAWIDSEYDMDRVSGTRYTPTYSTLPSDQELLLLHELWKANDPLARKVFKEKIALEFIHPSNIPVVGYVLEEKLLQNFFPKEDQHDLFVQSVKNSPSLSHFKLLYNQYKEHLNEDDWITFIDQTYTMMLKERENCLFTSEIDISGYPRYPIEEEPFYLILQELLKLGRLEERIP